MEIFLEFLTYGAIGIAMVLAVLSYRLLSKEQEKEHVREPMLKSIRNYFLLSIVLSLFFGATEITSSLIAPAKTKTTDVTKNQLDAMFNRLLPNENVTSTEGKLDRLAYYVKRGKNSNYDSNGEELRAQLEEEKRKSASLESELYIDAVYDLRDLVDADPLKFINFRHEPWNKERHFQHLYHVLLHLNKVDVTVRNKTEILQAKWEEYKKTYAIISERNQPFYVVRSDIDELVKLGLN
ncbi:MAG: hypothetical protein ACFHU9_16015 [Fluviicola sp.]